MVILMVSWLPIGVLVFFIGALLRTGAFDGYWLVKEEPVQPGSLGHCKGVCGKACCKDDLLVRSLYCNAMLLFVVIKA